MFVENIRKCSLKMFVENGENMYKLGPGTRPTMHIQLCWYLVVASVNLLALALKSHK